MALPFGAGDLIACIALCREIFDNFVSVGEAHKSHEEFRSAARALKAGLEQIVEVISDRNRLARIGAQPGGFRESPNDRATSSALNEITSDFSKTLETIRLRLRQHPIDDSSSLKQKFKYWRDAEDEIKELLDRCRHHITTLNFLLEPFKT